MISGDDVTDVLIGFLDKLIEVDDFDNIKTCMTDLEGLDKEFSEVVEDFEKKDIKDITAGVQLLLKIINEIPTDL